VHVDTAGHLLPKSLRRPPPRQRIQFRLWIPIAVAALAVIYMAVIALNWPFKEQALIEALQERSLRTVAIGHFYRTYFPPGCTAEDVRFLHRKQAVKEQSKGATIPDSKRCPSCDVPRSPSLSPSWCRLLNRQRRQR
jgi:hypothetical protein